MRSRPVVLLILIALLWMPTDGAVARADDQQNVLNASGLGEGTCTPTSVGTDEVVTCRWPLVDPTVSLPLWGVYAQVTGLPSPDWSSWYQRGRCHLEASHLVCPDLVPGYDEGALGVWLNLEGSHTAAASVRVDRTRDGVVGAIRIGSGVSAAWAGAPRRVGVFRSSSLDADAEVVLQLRRSDSDEVVAEFPGLAPGEAEAMVDVVFPEPGRWTLAGCHVGPDGCVKVGFKRPWDVYEPTPKELIPGHNLPGADRINLLFVGSGWVGERDEFVSVARTILSHDGEPIRIGPEGIVGPDDLISYLQWGPFSIDPLRQAVHKFNFWYLDEDVPPTGFSRFSDSEFPQISMEPLGLGGHVATVILNRTHAFSIRGATAEYPSFEGMTDLPPKEEITFGSTDLPYGFINGDRAQTFSHEVGHLLFDLADEYWSGGREAEVGYPNCAPDMETATAWWGDLVGEVDPMFHRWKETEEQAGTWWYDDDAEADFTTGFAVGGCYGEVEDGLVRPTVSGLMNGEEPVFGSVNRRRVEEVLALWSGRATLDLALHADRVHTTMETTETDDGLEVVVAAAVGTYLDAPGQLILEVGDTDVTCAWEPTDEGAAVECPPVVVPGGATALVALRVDETAVELDAVTAPTTTTTTVPPTTVAPSTTVAPADTTSPDDAGVPWIPIAGVGVLVFGAGVLLGRRRGD